MKKILIAVMSLTLSVAVAYASGGGGHEAGGVEPSITDKDFIFRVINFAVLVGGLVFLLRKPVGAALKQRSQAVRSAINEARQAREDAEKKARYYDEMIAGLDKEIAAIAAKYKEESEAERERLAASAKAQVDQMQERMRKTLEQETLRLKTEVMAEASVMAVALAEEMIRKQFSSADQKKWVKDYISMMERVQ